MNLPLGYTNFPVLCLNVVWRELNFLQNIMLACYSDDIMLIELDKQEVAKAL